MVALGGVNVEVRVLTGEEVEGAGVGGLGEIGIEGYSGDRAVYVSTLECFWRGMMGCHVCLNEQCAF